MDENKLRSKRREVEEYGGKVDALVDSICKKYSNDLDDLVNKLKIIFKDSTRLTVDELEIICLKVPVYMYNLAEGLESIGIMSDSAKTIKLEEYNNHYANAHGTINDKKAESENLVLTETFVELAYTRAYKKLKLKYEVCNQLCSAIKNVLRKRLSEIELSRN